MSSWYYVRDGQRNGPVNRVELDARIAERAVDADTLVWRTGMSAWVSAGSVPELGFPPAVPPPPLPPSMPAERPAGGGDDLRGWAAGRALENAEKELTEARLASPTEYAGFWVRFLAKVVDSLIVRVFCLLVQHVVVSLYFGGVPPNLLVDWEGWLRLTGITLPINVAIVLAYSVYFIRRHEATPGKRMLGLRVVRADGGRLGAGRVIGRYFAEQVSGLVFLAGFVMAAFDEEKRALHDFMCDTRVVKGEREEE